MLLAHGRKLVTAEANQVKYYKLSAGFSHMIKNQKTKPKTENPKRFGFHPDQKNRTEPT